MIFALNGEFSKRKRVIFAVDQRIEDSLEVSRKYLKEALEKIE